MLFAIFIAALIPVTLCIWIANVILYSSYDNRNTWEPISPLRLALSISLPILMCHYGLQRKSLSSSGAKAGFLVGMLMTLSNYCFMATMIAFFLVGSKITKWRSRQKQKLDAEFKEGGQRNWLQVICNAGVASELALVYLIDSGCAEYPIDFQKRYNASWLSAAVIGALACCCGDTFASEIGSVVGEKDPWLLLTFRRVPKGTNGAVSVVGTLSSIAGGCVTGVTYFIFLHLCANQDIISNSPPQWPIVVLGGLCGLIGSLVDSFLGATLQYSGFDTERGYVVNRPGDGVRHISGIPLLDNHGVNLLSSVILAFLAPQLALHIWGYFVHVR